MSPVSQPSDFEALREFARRRLLKLGAPEHELSKARAHILGGHVAWYFGNRSRTRPSWLKKGPKARSFGEIDRLGPRTITEWYAALMAVLNSILDAEIQSEEWWLLREKANSLHAQIRQFERERRFFSKSASRRVGQEGSTKRAIRQIAGHVEVVNAKAILNAMRDDDLMADLYFSRSEPLPIEIIEVDDENQKVHYRRRNGQVRELSFGSVRNIVSQIRKEN